MRPQKEEMETKEEVLESEVMRNALEAEEMFAEEGAGALHVLEANGTGFTQSLR